MTELRKTIATVGDFARYFHKSPDQSNGYWPS